MNVLPVGNTCVGGTGDLIDVIADVMDLRAQGLEFRVIPRLDWLSLNQSNQVRPLAESAGFDVGVEQIVLLRGHFKMHMVFVLIDNNLSFYEKFS